MRRSENGLQLLTLDGEQLLGQKLLQSAREAGRGTAVKIAFPIANQKEERSTLLFGLFSMLTNCPIAGEVSRVRTR